MRIESSEANWPALRRASRTVVVVDVVESVRLIEQNEDETVRRWQAFVGTVATTLLRSHGGRLVKSLGDGLMLEFESVPRAVECALAMQATIGRSNHGRPSDNWMQLRVGIHIADVIVDEHDIYGSGVNLAARLTTLAGPGEIVVSAEAHGQLVHGLDAEIDHLGACYLKHIAEPVHAYRVRALARPEQLVQPTAPGPAESMMFPTIAVIPFESRSAESLHDVLGELIADNVIASLSTSASIRVISRLSTSALRSRAHSAREVGQLLGASFVFSGAYFVIDARVVLRVELADARTQEVMWAEQFSTPVADTLHGSGELAASLSVGIMNAISAGELRKVQTRPLPTLEGFSLQLAATAMMHRSSRRDFDLAREVLEHLIERHPRAAVPRAWLAKWLVLRVTRGLVDEPHQESQRALDQTRRALDIAPDNSLALAVEGFVHCHMLRDLETAERRYELALRLNPNESIAWLYRSVLQAFRGQGDEAVESAERALQLSPLDPMRYYYESLGATAAMAAGRHDRAIELAEQSLKTNRTHTSSWRVLAISCAQSGRAAQAAEAVKSLLELQPDLTVRKYLARLPAGQTQIVQGWGDALARAGLPH